MIIFTATLSLIIAVVIALAGVAAGSGSIHSLGGHFVLSGHQLSSLSAGKLFPSPIVVRIASLLGFSMLLGACTWRLTSRGPQPVLTDPATRPRRCAWTATGSPANPSSAREPTSGGLGEVLHAAAAAKQHHDQVRLRCTDGRWPEFRSLRNGGSLVSCIGWHDRRACR